MSINNNNNGDDIGEEQVALYLKNHPGFFLKRDDLLCELELAHPSGSAVSLLERQVNLLRERNIDVRGRLNGLLDNARDNDKLFEKTKALVLKLLEAKGLEAIGNSFNHGLKEDFGMEFSSLTLFGSSHNHAGTSRVVKVDEAFEAIPGLLKSGKATCGALRPEECRFLFGEKGGEVGSAAVMPLVAHQTIGVIAVGSRDAHYFRSSMGTMFLNYLAEVLARIVPKHLS